MDKFVILIAYVGLMFGALRVIPQTIMTIKTKNIHNLSYTFFVLHASAAIVGFIYEIYSIDISIPHVLFFAMVAITNALQIIYMLYLRSRRAH